MIRKPNDLSRLLGGFGLSVINGEPTHFTDYTDRNTLIDIIATNNLDIVDSIHTESNTLSNHRSVELDIKRKSWRIEVTKERFLTTRRIGMC